jgi:hypothetical protein
MGRFKFIPGKDNFQEYLYVIREFADALTQEVNGVDGVIRFPEVGLDTIKVELCGRTECLTYPLIALTYVVRDNHVTYWSSVSKTSETLVSGMELRKKLDEVASSDEIGDKIAHIIRCTKILSKK